jgi:MFS family permease
MRWLTTRTGLPSAALWLLAGTFVTTMGNGVHTFAVGKLLYDRTGSVAAFGIVIIVEQASTFLMQLVAGPWVDRGNPRRTCIQVELIRGASICLASAMLGSDQLLVWVMLMTLIIRVAQPFYRATTFSLAPALVPASSLGRFNGYSNVCLQAGELLGVALAGVLMQQWGPSAAFLVNGLTFLFSAMAVRMVVVPAQLTRAQVAAGAAWKQLLESWHEIAVLLRHEAGLAWHLTLSTADALAVNLFNLVVVAIIAERFGGSAYWLSVVGCAFAVGAIASGAAVTRLTTRWGSRMAVIVGIGGQAICFVLLGLTEQPWLTVVLSLGLGAFNTISWTVVMTTLQLRLGGPVQGRIGTARSLLTAVLTVMLVPLVSSTQAISLEWALVMTGAVCLGFAAIAVIFGLTRAAEAGLLGHLQREQAIGV